MATAHDPADGSKSAAVQVEAGLPHPPAAAVPEAIAPHRSDDTTSGSRHGVKRVELGALLLAFIAAVASFAFWCGTLQQRANALDNSTGVLSASIDDFKGKLSSLTGDPQKALRTFDAIAVHRELVTQLLRDRAWSIINSSLLTEPTDLQQSATETLQTHARSASRLYEVTDAASPSIYTVIACMDIANNSIDRTSAAFKQTQLESIVVDDPKAFALAQILLATYQIPVTFEGSKSDKGKNRLDRLTIALRHYPKSAAALNGFVSITLFELNKQYDGKRLSQRDYLAQFQEIWPQYRKVQQFDPTMIGRFKYHNNSAYTLSLLLLRAVEAEHERRIPITRILSTVGMVDIPQLIKFLLDSVDSAIDTEVDPDGARVNAAEVYAALGAFCSDVEYNGVMSQCPRSFSTSEVQKGTSWLFERAVHLYREGAEMKPERYPLEKRREDVSHLPLSRLPRNYQDQIVK